MKRTLLKTLLAAAVVALALPAAAQTKLKWAHVYETSEPYHTESVWAAEEIKKRTNGKFEIQVFPACSLGKETDINQGMTLGTVDMIISGPSFAARSYPRIGIAYYPFIFRDADHLLAYSKSDVFKEMIDGYRAKTGIQILAYTYYGARHTTAQKAFTDCAGMKGMKIRVPDVPAYRATPESLRRQPDADRLRRGLPGAAERHRRGAGEPADHDRGEEVLRGAEAHHADRPHRRRPDDAGRAARLEQAVRRREEDLLRRGAGGRRARHRADQEARGRTGRRVQEEGPGRATQVNRQSFVDAVLKNKSVESLGFDKKDYDRIVAIK